MKQLRYFFSCYFHKDVGIELLDAAIQHYKKAERAQSVHALLGELYAIIQIKNYSLAVCIMKKNRNRSFDTVHQVEHFIRYLYAQLLDQSFAGVMIDASFGVERAKSAQELLVCSQCQSSSSGLT